MPFPASFEDLWPSCWCGCVCSRPKALCEKLAELQEAAPPHAWRFTEAALAEALGADWAARLHISDADRARVLGSGCVAQVYRGTSLTGGDERCAVAVKVLHPGIEKVVAEDLALMRAAATLLERCVPKLATLGPCKVQRSLSSRSVGKRALPSPDRALSDAPLLRCLLFQILVCARTCTPLLH